MIQANRDRGELSFRIGADTFKQIDLWCYTIDKTVFKEQLATGKFLNHDLSPGTLANMRRLEQQGEIRPYYGAIGGVWSYQFRFAVPDCQIVVEHGTTGQTLKLCVPGKISRFAFANSAGPEMPICRIDGQEYRNLTNWNRWNSRQALTNRYEYRFCETSIGDVVIVKDISNNEIIDVSDYEGW